jgi:hypothetical protein
MRGHETSTAALPRIIAGALAAALAACTTTAPDGNDPTASRPVASTPDYAMALSTYFPPAETGGGWRTTGSPAEVLALGIDPVKADSLGAYVMSVPYESYNTGVSGYSASNKAVLIVKNGWLAGEYYNQASASTGVYYLASNGKTFSIMLMGRLQLEYPALGVTPSSLLYDPRWLPNGYPLSDPRKADITLDQVFQHTSGIVPQVEAPIAAGPFPVGPTGTSPRSPSGKMRTGR